MTINRASVRNSAIISPFHNLSNEVFSIKIKEIQSFSHSDIRAYRNLRRPVRRAVVYMSAYFILYSLCNPKRCDHRTNPLPPSQVKKLKTIWKKMHVAPRYHHSSLSKMFPRKVKMWLIFIGFIEFPSFVLTLILKKSQQFLIDSFQSVFKLPCRSTPQKLSFLYSDRALYSHA